MLSKKPKIDFSFQHYFLFALITLFFFLTYSMMKPYINSIIMGTLLSFLFIPLNNKYLSITKGKKNVSAFFSSMTLAFVVILPVIFILVSIIFQGINSFQSIYQWFSSAQFDVFEREIEDGIIKLKGAFPFLTAMIPDTSFADSDIQKQILNFFSSLGRWMMGQASNILGSTINLAMSFFIMMVVFFIMTRDQDKILNSFFHIIPLKSSQEEKIMDKTRELFKSVIFGNLFTSLAQGAAGGIGFAIAGFQPIFWGAAIALASLIPVVGTALIWIPAAIWLFIVGRAKMALFIILWFIIVVGLLDNILRPLFIKGEDGMSPVLIFFAILGGINVWGLLGLIYGPMVFGLGFVLIYIYSIEFYDYLKYQDDN